MPVPTQIPKISRALVREEVRSQLQSWIVEGVLLPEETLNDKQLAGMFGVSRMPVREALRSLEDVGLVETSLNRWTRVAPLHLEQAQNLYTLLATLEGLALRASHGKLSESDFQTLQVATDDLADALAKKDAVAATLADLAFHSVWVHRAANPQLEKSVEECRMKLRRIEIRYFHWPTDVRQSLQEHRALSVALARHSLQEALRELRHHWQASTERCLKQLANPSSKTAHRISEGK